MITFLDENDVEYGALATIKATNAVNGERSITGEIISGDVVLSRIERGWRLRFEDEYYVVTFAKPIDEGKNVRVSFDAVHQFFWDFGKSSVYDQLSDGSHTFRAYLDFIFNSSGYKYDIETSLTVKAFEKQSFGYKNRLSLFNDIITSSGVEFQVNGKVVRILAKVGTDLSTVVRKNFNLNELGIEKNIGDFVTYQKGFGAYFDEEDHSKGRLIAEYTSPLASVYGKLEADPLVDERYKQQESLLSALKNTVDNSYTISVSLDMEDLTRAGYRYTQPVAGDYIMAINETLGFKEKIRIVSFTSEYDVAGQLIKHTVTCNDIGSVKKLSASYTQTQHQAANAEANANTAYEFANKALVSANGKNTNYYGDTFPVDNPKGTLKKGDLLFLTVGDTVKQYYWNGADWVINPVLDDVEAFKEQIAEELKDVPDREEFENTISEEIANSKAEITTQIETAKTQAESNAKEYADTINQEIAKVAELANAAAGEIKADLVNVKNNLTETSLVANNAKAAVDAAKQDLTNVTSELNTAKQELTSHAQQLQTQANAQTELTKRVTTVESTANGTKTTVSELTKTVAQNGKDITSVTARTKVVEDDLTSTKTTLSQVKTTAESASQKTATLETGLDGLSAKFENLSVGTTNHFLDSAFETTIQKIGIFQNGNVYTPSIDTTEKYYGYNTLKIVCNDSTGVDNPKITYPALAKLKTVQQGKLPDVVTISFWGKSNTEGMVLYTRLGFTNYESSQNVTLTTDWKRYIVHVRTSSAATNEWLFKFSKAGTVWIAKPQFEFSAIASDYHSAEEDTSSKVAEYKQNADQNYASLQSSLQTLDGTVKQNKSEFDQTASQIKSSISAVEGKIPTSVGARNYIRNYGLTATGWKFNTAGWKIEIISDSTAKSGQYLKATCTTASTSGGGFYKNLFDFSDGRLFGKQMTWAMDIKLSKAKNVKIGPEWGYAYLDFNATTEWKRYSKTFTVATTTEYNNWIFYTNDKIWNVGDIVYIRDVQLEDGSIATTPVPAIEDTAEQISSLSSEIKQTADGITLLATKTELNTAKNELQSGINTHTTQISALNTGLQAKVSQSEFNTLSGRVTNAENNITAKANELSSKITSVEGKIPTNLDSLNLMTGTRDWSTKVNKWHMGANWSTESGEYQGLKVHSTQKGYNGSHQNIFVKNGDVVTFSFFAKATNTLSKIKVSSRWSDSPVYQAPLAGVKESDEQITITSEWKRYSKTVHITSDGSLQFRTEYDGSTIPDGNTFYVAGLKLAKTSQDTGYSENPTDLASDISSVEGKIPTSVWMRNYALKTSDSKSVATAGDKLYDLSSAFDGIDDDATLIIEFDWSVTAPTSTSKFRINRVIKYSDGTAEQWTNITYKVGEFSDISTSSGSGHFSGTFKNTAYNGTTVSSRYLHLNQSTASGTVTISNLSIRVGSLKSDWQPAPEDAISQINSVSSEFKQTTDAIKASVSSLNNSTVKSSSLTINSDGIVMKAGKSTTDVANAIGSYFAVNQNAINLFSDRINVKGSMIVNGAITSDKIASKSINTAHLNGKIITADVISSNAVTADAIRAGAVTTDKMSANSINGDRIAAGTLDAAKIKAGSITASQIASGTITSAQIKTGTISAANIAAGAITSDKIASNSIDASKIAANAITANMITGGKLKSTNGATVFDLNAGTLTFNNNYGYIQRIASDKIFEITTYLGKSSGSRDYLDSAFNIRKSDNSRRAGIKFTLYNDLNDKPTAEANIHADALTLYDSQYTRLFEVWGKSTFMSNFNFRDWGNVPVAQIHGGFLAQDIGLRGHTESLKVIVERLCKKAGVMWL